VHHVLDDDELAAATSDGGFVSEMSTLREAALTRLVDGAVELLDMGADVIALGCSCMAPARDELQDRLGCPVVDPVLAGHTTAEMLVTMGLVHRPVPVASGFARSLTAMLSGASCQGREVDICGDTCSVLASPVAG
jgi:Asp/Glu/hydantoin racemase